MTPTLPALQAADLLNADALDEPRFSLLDGRYHESAQTNDEDSAAQGSTALALRGIAALAVQRGEASCVVSLNPD